MWNSDNKAQFEAIVKNLLQNEEVQAMREISQHGKTSNRLDHSIYVAYLSFLICRKLGLDYVSAARAGILHDFHKCTHEDGMKRLWKHPHDALQQANEHYELSDVEQDIIVKHMWPLTRPMPKYLESHVVSIADKFCAMMEMSRIYKKLNVMERLSFAPSPA